MIIKRGYYDGTGWHYSRSLDLTGGRFGQLVARRIIRHIPGKGNFWECDCDCGAKVVVPTALLNGGRKRSCGCWNANPKRDETMARMPTKHILYRLRVIDRKPLAEIARQYGVGEGSVAKAWKDYGLPKFALVTLGRVYRTNAGYYVRSSYERSVANWLHAHALPHTYDQKVPWRSTCRADFLVGTTYIEIWGLASRAHYRQRTEVKRRKYRRHGLQLLELWPGDFLNAGSQWEAKLREHFFPAKSKNRRVS